MDRRLFLSLLAGLAAAGPIAASDVAKPRLGGARPFSTEMLRDRAQAMAAKPFQPRKLVPEAWRNLTYDEYRTIWFNSERALWAKDGKAAEVDFFHPGLYFPRAVQMHVVDGAVARPIAFDIALFDRTDKSPDLPMDDSMGYSGLRLRGALEQAGIYQEYAVFQGASYFRALAKGQVYGLSARGLALNTGEAEEFPEFTDFWIETPAPDASTVTLHALMDSPSVAGVYTFVVQHGDTTVMDVTATLFPRVVLDHAGIAPLTSMFLFDQTNRTRFDDFRRQVHDSDGLLIENGAGEVLWRPLANPARLQVSSFVDDAPRGFGLMQRARRFEDFADLEAKYHLRPGLWVEPIGNWGAGAVTLVEIPADKEVYDNIVAYWRPEIAMQPGVAHDLSYRLHWGTEPELTTDVARVLNTSMGQHDGRRLVKVDFADVPTDLDQITLDLSSSAGDISTGILQRNPATGGVRLGFSFDPGDAGIVELRAVLRVAGTPVSEVWLYRWLA